ncbi:hypothetical protein BDN72DRAFT_890632 [Pluteus cervinus]|uniref:Uncharacterized protein n=1 Tax=Pluteus cervinus TaxID=181527 RepID=A0ACD3BG03_9AGAR|nr:hypothetical protein BDN72DRAFT_890632 [Pluteus cervinus]
MHITFCPAIGETLHLPPTTQKSAQLRFTADLSKVDYETLVQQDAVIQLWTDISVPDSSAGAWNSIDFSVESTYSAGDNDDETLVTSPNPTMSSETHDMVHLSLCLPVSSSFSTQFSYTYRLVYPGRRISWLGQYGQNGAIHLDRMPQLNLVDGWAELNGEHMWKGSPTEVAQIHRLHDYAIWAFGGDSFGASVKPNLLFLVPKNRGQFGICAHTFIFSSSSSPIILSSSGVITYSGPPSSLQLCIACQHAQIMDHASRYTSAFYHLLPSDAKTGHVVLSSGAGTYPTTVAALPLYPTHPRKRTFLDLGAIRPLVPAEVTHVAIFAPSAADTRFLEIPSEGQPQYLSSAVNASGSQFLIAPAYPVSLEPNRNRLFAVLSSYTQIRFPQTLPTPPPSPLVNTFSGTQLSNGVNSHSPNSVNGNHNPVWNDKSANRPPRPNLDVTKRNPLKSNPSWWVVCAKLMFAIVWAIFVIVYRRFFHHRVNSRPTKPVLQKHTTKVNGHNPSPGGAAPLTGERMEQLSEAKSAVIAEVEIQGGWGAVLVQPSQEFGPITIEQQGRPLETLVQSLNASVGLLEFKGHQGGLLKVALARMGLF